MKTITKVLALAAAIAVSTSMAYADPLGAGVLSFATNGAQAGDVWSATSISFDGGDALVGGTSQGSLSGFPPGDQVSINGFTFSAIPSNFLLFSVTNSAAVTLDYYLTSVVTSISDGNLTIMGLGYFTETGVSGDTSGTIDLTTQGVTPPASTFSLTATIAPEPNSLLLFGTGLLFAAEVARRRFAAKAAL